MACTAPRTVSATTSCVILWCRLVREAGLQADAQLFQGFDGRAAASAPAAAVPLNGRPITYAQAKNWLLKGVAKVRGVSVQETLHVQCGMHHITLIGVP